MKSCIVVCVLSLAVMALVRSEEEHYSDPIAPKWLEEQLDEACVKSISNLNVDNCIKLMLNQGGSLSQTEAELKEQMIDCFENNSDKCTETQIRRIVSHLIDPERKSTDEYEKKLEELKREINREISQDPLEESEFKIVM